MHIYLPRPKHSASANDATSPLIQKNIQTIPRLDLFHNQPRLKPYIFFGVWSKKLLDCSVSKVPIRQPNGQILAYMNSKITFLLLLVAFPLAMSAQIDLTTRNQLQAYPRYTRINLARQEANMVRRLDLSMHELFEIPTDLAIFKNCLEFSFSENKLTVLPDAVFQMPNLQYITGFKNLLGNFPKNVDDCQSLQEIDLSWNRIGGLPKEIGNLPNLRILKLNNNLIKAIPYEAGTLASLEEIHMSVNQMERLPSSLNQMQNLKRLDVSYNFITEVPACIGELKNLEYVDLSFNMIGQLPDSIAYCENLKVLNLRGNRLKALPGEITRMKNLKELDLKKNKITPKQHAAIQAKLPYCKIYF